MYIAGRILSRREVLRRFELHAAEFANHHSRLFPVQCPMMKETYYSQACDKKKDREMLSKEGGGGYFANRRRGACLISCLGFFCTDRCVKLASL